ncbi:MAG: DNA mismatch repair protein MutS [Ruminococcus sp.]|nr:DNA mismatch repair protein MutS [Ruminococcus sp.]
MNIDRTKLSPMMRQYLETKDKYSDAILFFRLGDFYEMFFDDALTVSKLLELTLTGRDCGLEERAPMCGVPYHSSEIYIKRLIALGYKVAICEQLTDPAETKGLVERDVIRLVTPGTLIESSMLDDAANNFIACAYRKEDECALCFADISTGEVILQTFSGRLCENDIMNALSRYSPAELIFNADFLALKPVADFIQVRLRCAVTLREDACFAPEEKRSVVLAQFAVPNTELLGLSECGVDCACVCGLFDYIADTQKALVGRFTEIRRLGEDACLTLDLTARRNLELTETLRTGERRGSLLWVLDRTSTSMGKRLLKNWVEQPLRSPARILERLGAVDALCKKSVILLELNDVLRGVYDLERLMTRVMYKTATPRDLKSLAATAQRLPEVKALLAQVSDSKLLAQLDSKISTLEEAGTLISKALVDDPPITVKDGGVIRDGYNEQLDTLRGLIGGGTDLIAQIEQREKEETGIKGLKIGFNRVFGYYLEVTRSYYDLVPDRYIRKQTLANCERFITEELKNAENTILGAKDKALVLESQLFSELRDYLATQLAAVQETAGAVASVDVLCSLANAARENDYTCPEIAIDGPIDIKDGRHPVVEKMLKEELFVPNDALLDTKANRLTILTGPNMAGKSTYMRQVALITLMAHIGSFVPARYAKISVTDRIFTRVGASDDLAAGQSTFMVEMTEVAEILRHATKQSLVILDEVGRGTSTFDGISIARAVAEYVANPRTIGCKTLFATHYHELISLEHSTEGVKNLSVAVQKHGDSIRFLRKIVPGGTDDSYGIDVAKLAGLPPKVLSRARTLLSEMESASAQPVSVREESGQISFQSQLRDVLAERVLKTNPDELSDSECRDVLEDFIRLAKES